MIEGASAVDQVRNALNAGDLLLAVDLADNAISEGSGSERIKFLRVLALARMGDIDHAMALHQELADQEDEDVAGLKGRLLKDGALFMSGDRKRSALERAFRQYLQTYERTSGYFSGINAATIAWLTGKFDSARSLSMELLGKPILSAPEDYWSSATRAEALLLLGRFDEAVDAIRAAVCMPDAAPASRASTLRQFLQLRPTFDADRGELDELIEILRPPPLLLWSGHIFFDQNPGEQALAEAVHKLLDRNRTEIGYGALAAGSDIVIAEQLLLSGAAIDVVLPFSTTDFIAESVAPFGDRWVERFHAVCARAASVTNASLDGYLGDPGQFAYGSTVAMGLARLRADSLLTGVSGLAAWSGVEGASVAGTAADIQRMRHAGIEAEIVWSDAIVMRSARTSPPDASSPSERVTRDEWSIIFSDYAGFSGIDEARLPTFWAQVMVRISEVLKRHAEAVAFANSWGDALYAVVRSPLEAATIAIEIAESISAVDKEALGLSERAGMRIAVHHGQAYKVDDPITGRPTYLGGAVNLAARIEPITPTGSVYATAAFAANLRLAGKSEVRARYVGRMPLAKSYGVFSLYELTRHRVEREN